MGGFQCRRLNLLDKKHPTKAYVVHINLLRRGPLKKEKDEVFLSPGSSPRSIEARLEEACGLAAAIDLDVLGSRAISLDKPSPASLLNKGNIQLLKEFIVEKQVELVVIDGVLTPVQQRNLEKEWKVKVIDRTGLILEIFGRRARTAEGSLQVELAALTYQRSRLVRSWTHLERQRGGFGFTGGPGESQLELDRRLIDDRILKIKKQLEKAKQTRGLHRKSRKKVPYPIVALVGYTNAGKSTLFNTLTHSAVFAKDLLFATLDPTLRQIRLPSGRVVILSDTVGFISDLPTQLIAAFRATLEEVCEADIILHVRDMAHEDTDHQARDVYNVLKELGLDPYRNSDIIQVYNKMDLLDEETYLSLLNKVKREREAVTISALKNEGTEVLLSLLDEHLNKKHKVVSVTIPASAGDLLAWCYRRGSVLDREDDGNDIHLSLTLEAGDFDKFYSFLKEIKERT